MAFLCLSFAIAAKSQNCFGTEGSIVASLACANATMGFDVSEKAAEYGSSQKYKFTYQMGESTEVPLPSWYMMDKSGKAFNIHQYGFKAGGNEINIVYKIITRYTDADVAIVIEGKPVFHHIVSMSADKGNGMRTISGSGTYGEEKVRFELVLFDSDLAGFKFGTTTDITLRISKVI